MLIASLFFAAALAPASILLERPDFGYRDDPQTVDEEPQRFPDILSGMIVSHNGAKYLCGRSKTPDGSPGSRRYVFSLETDWQVWEPRRDNDTWEAWNSTYTEICNDGVE